MGIREWPVAERPREKLLSRGANVLSDSELLAIFLRTGVEGKTAVEVARDALSEAGSLRGLLTMKQEQVCETRGIGEAKYVQFQAALELGRRYLEESMETKTLLSSPSAVKEFLTYCLRDKPHEVFYVIFLNTKNHVIHHEELFRGTIDSADVPIREVVKEALQHNAASVIVAHNHPSGVAEPSIADQSLTNLLSMALSMVGMKLLDHLVVGDGEVVSFAEQGMLDS